MAIIDLDPASSWIDLDEPDVPQRPKSDDGNFVRGAKVALGQTLPLAKGVLGAIGAAGEQVFGEGGASTSLKDWGVKGYQDGMEKLKPLQHENDDVTVAWEKAKQGDVGALADWVAYGLGYGAVQIGEAALTGGVGSLLGKAGARAVASTAVSTMIERQAAKIAATDVGKTLGQEALTAAATKAVTQKIGAVGAGTALQGYNEMMEVGSIYPDAVEEAKKQGREMTGSDLAKAWGWGTLAAATESATDLLGLGALTGRVKMPGVGGRLARAGTGAGVGAAVEGGQEGIQTWMEWQGAGKDTDSPEFQRDLINSMAMGALPGAVVGGAAGALHIPQTNSAQPDQNILSADNADQAIAAAQSSLAQDVGNVERATTLLQNLGQQSGVVESENRYADQAYDQNVNQPVRDQAFADIERAQSEQRAAELVAAEQQRRDTDLPAAVEQQQAQLETERGQSIPQLIAAAEASGFNQAEPTAMQLAFQEAQRRRNNGATSTQAIAQKTQRGAPQQEITPPAANVSPAPAALNQEAVLKPEASFDGALIPHIPDPHEIAQNEFMSRARQVGLSDQQIQELLPVEPRDHVTGFFRAERKVDAVKRAQQYAKETGIPTFYVDADLKNLGGINEYFGENATEANKVYREISDIFHDELNKAAAQTIPVRTGGDEIGAVVSGIVPSSLETAKQRITARIADYAERNGMTNLPRKAGVSGEPGIGLHLGYADINPTKSLDEIFKEASDGVRKSKEESHVITGENSGTAEVLRNNGPSGIQPQVGDVSEGNGRERQSLGGAGSQNPREQKEHRVTQQTPANAGVSVSADAEITRVKAALDAANITGNDRIVAIAAARRGELTAEDIAEAHPQKADISEDTNRREPAPALAKVPDISADISEPKFRTQTDAQVESLLEDAPVESNALAAEIQEALTTKIKSRPAVQIVKESTLNSRVINAIAKVFKREVVFYRTDRPAPDGLVKDGGRIFINADASVSHLAILGHELTHQLKTDLPAAYSAIAQTLAKRMGPEKLIAQYRSYNGVTVEQMSDEQIIAELQDEKKLEALFDEMVSDYAGNEFLNEEFWQNTFNELAAKQTIGKAKRIVEMLRLFVARMVSRMNAALGNQQGFQKTWLAGETDSAAAWGKDVNAALKSAYATWLAEINQPSATTVSRSPALTATGNKGTFDGTNPDIRFSTRRDVERVVGEFTPKVADAIKADNVTTRQSIRISRVTPASLQVFGWDRLPVVARAGKDGILKMYYDHGMTAAEIGRIVPETLYRPAMILQHIGQNGVESLAFIANGEKSGRPVLVGVHPEHQGQAATGKVHLVATALPKDEGWKFVEKSILKGNLLYRDTAATVPGMVRLAIAEAQKRYTRTPRSLLGLIPNRAPLHGHAYKVLAQSDLVKFEGGMEASFSTARIVGDSGRTYTPQQRRAMENTGSVVNDLTIAERAKDIWQDAGKKMTQGIVDQFAPVREISDKAYTLLRLSKGATGAFEALMHHGKLSLRDGAFDADTSGGVIETVFSPIGKESTDFLRWVAANRAERLMLQGREHLFTKDDIKALKSLADGVADFDYTMPDGSVTRDRTKIYRDTLAKFNAFNKNVLDMAEQSGLIDGESRHLWEHEFYVPFYREADDKDGGVRGMNIKQGVIRQQAFKKLKGGDQKLNDLLSNTLMNWAHLIDASAKNRAAQATLEAAKNIGAAREATYGEKNTVWFMGNITRTIPKGQQYEENGVVKVSDGTVKIKQHGKVEYKVDDPYLLTALNGLEFSGLRGPAMNAMSKFKNMLTIGVTASPFFKVRNLIRDSLQAIGTSDLGYNPISNIKQGIALTNRERQEYVSALAGGGLIRFGTMLEGNEAARTRQLIKQGAKDEHILDNESKVRKFYDKYIEPGISAYNEIGNRGEEINRMALYDQLIKQGVDHAKASLMARDLMDFSMQGSFTTIRFLTQVVPFMNARLQGLYKLGRAAKEDPARFATVLGGVTLASLTLLAAYSDDDDWKKREDWDRDNYWWFKFGGEAFRIPKPFEIGAIATLAERSAELLFDKEMTGKRFNERLAQVLSDQLSMNPVPQLVKPIIDIYANKDSFTGRPIETMGMERLEPSYRFRQGTSMVARGISTAGNTLTGDHFLSPVQIDQLVRGYFSWLGTFVVSGADMMLRAGSSEPTRPALDYWKVASGGMVSDLNSAQSRYVSSMYDQAKELEQAYGTWHNMIKEGKVAEAREYQQANADKLKRYRSVEAVKRAEAKLNERIRIVERSNMSADDKRTMIDGIRQQEDTLARRLVPA